MIDVKQWTRVFKALANASRLKIIILLSKEKERAAGDIAREIHVSFPGTSRHLNQLAHVGIIDREGKAGQVFYSMNKDVPAPIQSILNKFLS